MTADAGLGRSGGGGQFEGVAAAGQDMVLLLREAPPVLAVAHLGTVLTVSAEIRLT